MTSQEVLNCSFALWYPNFQRHTIESIVLKVPEIFTQYLLLDGLFLPNDSCLVKAASTEEFSDDDEENISAHSLISSSDIEATVEEQRFRDMFETPEFKAFENEVVAAIDNLGGNVFPKMNWSSPKDAAWIAVNSSLCCQNFNDICLLLKSSNFITHDLTEPFAECNQANVNVELSTPVVEYTLVLRKWTDINPLGEYRCFVKESQLFAISQRSQQYSSFIELGKAAITRNISRFYKTRIRDKFPNLSYAFDVYIPDGSRKPVLIDFNPYSSVTDGLMFSWDELKEIVPIPELSTSTSEICTVFRSFAKEGMYIIVLL